MGNHVGAACQNHLYGKEHRRHKQERKLNGLCNTGQHTGQSCGQEKSSRGLSLFRFCRAVHGQGSAWKAEYHEDKLTGEIPGGIRAEMDHIRRSQLCEENVLAALNQISVHHHGAAHSGLPEWHVEYVVKSKGNQRPLYNTENQCACISCPRHQAAQGKYGVLYNRPYEVHHHTHPYIGHRGYDGHKTGTAEK